MRFINSSSAFNTIIPNKLTTKLLDLGLGASNCSWLLNFLTGRPQAVRIGRNVSPTLAHNTGAPQGCVLSTLLYSCTPINYAVRYTFHLIVKFAKADHINSNKEMEYRKEIKNLCIRTTAWPLMSARQKSWLLI